MSPAGETAGRAEARSARRRAIAWRPTTLLTHATLINAEADA